MDWDVVELEVIGHGILSVGFRDGLKGQVLFADSAFNGVFAKLRDPEEFSKAFIDGYFVTWPGQLDLAPDAMHAEIRAAGQFLLT